MRRPLARALVVGGALLGSAAAAVALERAAIRRARSRPDPERGTPLSERPGTERHVSAVDGTELAVNVIGPRGAPTIVFAHGFSLDMTAWHYQWAHFSKSFRCVLLDHRGHGRSARAASGDYSLDALGRDVKAVLDAEVDVPEHADLPRPARVREELADMVDVEKGHPAPTPCTRPA